MNSARRTRATDVVRERGLSVSYLTAHLCLAAQLFEHFNHLTGTGRTQWMAFRFQSAAGVHRRRTLVEASFLITGKQTAVSLVWQIRGLRWRELRRW